MALRGIILGAVLVAMICSTASLGLDTKVYTLCERNLSISPEFTLVPDESSSSTDGMFTQGFTVASNQSKGLAMLSFMDVYDKSILLLGPEFIENTWVMGVNIGTSLLSPDGNYEDRVIGNWSTTDFAGHNVTVSTVSTNNTLLSAFGKKADLASWNAEGNRYFGVVSFFDRNTTQKMINTLRLA